MQLFAAGLWQILCVRAAQRRAHKELRRRGRFSALQDFHRRHMPTIPLAALGTGCGDVLIWYVHRFQLLSPDKMILCESARLIKWSVAIFTNILHSFIMTSRCWRIYRVLVKEPVLALWSLYYLNVPVGRVYAVKKKLKSCCWVVGSYLFYII